MAANQAWWVYMIETDSGMLYTGITTDVERRFNEHRNDRKKAAKFFRGKKAQALVFLQACEDRSQDSKIEAAIKKLSKQQKRLIIQQQQFTLEARHEH